MRPWCVALGSVLLVFASVSAVLGADGDGDLLDDDFETGWGITSPDDPDSDGDGVVDSAEDPDHDDLSNLGEQRFGTNPSQWDSDSDGKPDGREDKDGNGRSDALDQDRRPIPSGLRPSLNEAKFDVSPYKAGCQTTHGKSALTICRYGPTDAARTVVLMGDSHAMMILSPIRTVAVDRGWRLITLVKKACPPVLGIHNISQKWLDDGRSCRKWRRKALDWLDAKRPDHIVIAHSDQYRVANFKGKRLSGSTAARAWRKGMKRTLSSMPAAAQVLLMGDIPVNRGNPVQCLKKHPNNISVCSTRKEPAGTRIIERALKQAAEARGATFRSIYGKVCSYDPCPIIQGRVLMWRDRGHYSTTFADQLTPTFRSVLTDVVAPARERR